MRCLKQPTTGLRHVATNDAQKPTGERYTLAYDVDSRRTTMQLGNGTTRAYAYDANSRLTTQIELNGVAQLVTIVDSYDAVGNRIGRNLDGVITTWTYDDLYRLTHQNKPGQVCTYVLDPVGNLEVMWEATANPKTFTFDAADRLVTMVEGTGTTSYTYTGYGALEVTVDSRGTRTTNTYDGQDQLIKVQRGGGGVVGTTSTYTFDGDGMRRTAQEGNVQPTTMVWDGSDYLFLDGPSSDNLVLTLDEEIVACGSKDLLTDPLGTLLREISVGASLSGAFGFYPYGSPVLPMFSPPTIPFRYIAAWGYFFDTNDRDYVRARELEKRLGRWMQTDPLWPDEQEYEVTRSSPITFADPSGLACTPSETLECLRRGYTTCTEVRTTTRFLCFLIRTRTAKCSGRRSKSLCRKCPPPCYLRHKTSDGSSAHYPCPGGHLHIYVYDQRPFPDCRCFLRKMSPPTCYDDHLPDPPPTFRKCKKRTGRPDEGPSEPGVVDPGKWL